MQEYQKFCPKCQKKKLASEYYKDPQINDGLRTYCKSCWNAKSICWGKNNRERKNRSSREWRKRNPKKAALYKRRANYKSLYKLTLEEYNNLLESQNGVCAICKNPETLIDKRNQSVKALAVDHDHKTGKVRGLLCNNCNRGIGLLKENLVKATEYLYGKTS